MRRMHIQFGFPGRGAMYLPITPKSGAERIADYRKRHPDRVEAYNAHRRAQRQMGKARLAEARLRLQQQAAAERMLPDVPAPLLLPAPPVRLCLPAPAELPAIILPLQTPEPVLVAVTRREQTRDRRAV